jgi:hypothetical protein
MNYIKDKTRSITIPANKKNYIFSQKAYVDIDSPYKAVNFNIRNEDIHDNIDNAYDINEEECDIYKIKYAGKDKDFIFELIGQLQDVLKKPLIFDIDNDSCLNSALRSYCGIAAVTSSSLNSYGAVKISL